MRLRDRRSSDRHRNTRRIHRGCDGGERSGEAIDSVGGVVHLLVQQRGSVSNGIVARRDVVMMSV